MVKDSHVSLSLPDSFLVYFSFLPLPYFFYINACTAKSLSTSFLFVCFWWFCFVLVFLFFFFFVSFCFFVFCIKVPLSKKIVKHIGLNFC